jgi:hypothetical protein
MNRRRLVLLSLVVISSLLIAAHLVSRLPIVAERTANAKRDTILAEIKALGDHEWAGEYYAGDGLGVNISLAIAPDSGYVFEWHGCLGLYDRNYGSATWSDGRIRLSFTFDNKRGGFRGIAPVFIPVSWGPRRYLIPEDDAVGFCNSVNDGREPRMGIHGFYLLRRGDEKKDVAGFPNVPDRFRAYLLTEPIEATIVAVGAVTIRPSVAEWKFKDTAVTLDAGTEKGVRVGMELVVTQPEHTVQSVQITKVEVQRSEAIMTQIGEEQPAPEAGWRVSTEAPWNKQRRSDR